MSIKFSNLALAQVSIPAAAYTAGTQFNVAHGLAVTPHIRAMLTVAYDTDDSDDHAQSFAIISADGTNVRLKPTRTTTASGLLWIFMDTAGKPPLAANQ